MASRLLVVFGATGQQGGSVIKTVLADPELNKQYKIRALTRDTSSPASQALKQKGVEVASADIDNTSTLGPALQGAHTVVGITVTPWVPNIKEAESKRGKLMADAVVASGAQYYIFSSLTHALKTTGKSVEMFDCKAEVEDYIRTLPIKSAFFYPGVFMQNWFDNSKPRPTSEAGVYAFANIIRPNTPVPLIDTANDAGKYIAPILAYPAKYAGKIMYGASGLWTYNQVAEALSKTTGKTIKYNQIPVDVFKSFLPPHMAPHYAAMLDFIDDPGCFGADQKELVEWTHEQMREKPTGLGDFFQKNSIQIE